MILSKTFQTNSMLIKRGNALFLKNAHFKGTRISLLLLVHIWEETSAPLPRKELNQRTLLCPPSTLHLFILMQVSNLSNENAEGVTFSQLTQLKKATMLYVQGTRTEGHLLTVYSLQFSSVAQSCRTLCNPMNRSTPGLPVHQQLLESTQTHVH